MDKQEITRLVSAVKADISDEYRAFEDDEEPGIQLTVATTDGESWGFQTGDNSFTGGAYSFAHWGVVGVYRDSDPEELAKELIDQIEELIESATF